jgi:acyl carrier protein
VPERDAGREAFSHALVEFITALVRERRRAATRPSIEIDESTPLFETGLIDSLGILELLAFVEETTGRSIPIQMVDMKHFRTVDHISRSFWHKAGEDADERTISAVRAHQNRA